MIPEGLPDEMVFSDLDMGREVGVLFRYKGERATVNVVFRVESGVPFDPKVKMREADDASS